jgi:hypothetical protein
MASETLLERFLEEIELEIDPMQIIVSGLIFDVKKIDKPLYISKVVSEVVIDADLRDGRKLTFPLSSLQGFISGRSWE